MDSKLVSVFFYGHFMDRAHLRRRGFTAAAPKRACLDGMRIVVGKRAYLTPNRRESVFGVVLGMTMDELSRLYAHPDVEDYEAESVVVRLDDGSRLKALCYNLATDTDVESADPDYAAKLLAVATQLGLPKSYLDKLEKIGSSN